MNMGQQIRNLRKEKNMTLKELSKESGVALATLSRIENNLMTGTLESHTRICNTLGITLSQLYRDVELEGKTIDFHGHKETADVYTHPEKSSFDILTNKVLSKKMMPVLLKLEPDGKTNTEQTNKDTEKFFYVITGKIDLTIGKETFSLERGDSIYFDASVPHSCKNAARTQARCLCVTTPPAL